MVAPRNPTRDEQDKHRRKCWHTALLRVLAAANLLAEAIEGLEGTDAEHQVVRAQDAADFLEEATGWIERGKGLLMARSSNQGGRFPRRKPDGDAAPQPVQTGAEPCSSDGEAWSESLRLLDELRKLRGIMRVRVDEEYAESLVAHHLRRVRASRWNVGLYRVMRLGRLDGERFVLVLYVLAAYYGHLFIPSLRDALALAAGFHPVRVRTLGIWATQEGRLFRFDEQGKIHPSQTLVEMASGAAPISDQEAEWFHEVLAKWPTKERHNE